VNDEPKVPAESAEVLRDRIKRALKAKRRLAAVDRLDILDHAHKLPSLDRAARLTARALRVPVVQVNVITAHDLVPVAVWSAPEEPIHEWRAPRRAGHSLCKFVMVAKEPLVIRNAQEDALIRQAYATTELNIGAYLGVPIFAEAEGSHERAVVGTVCALDHVPRAWSRDDIEMVSDVAAAVGELLSARTGQRGAMRSAGQPLERILDAVAAGVLATDAGGVTTFANHAAQTMLGYSASELVGHDQHALIHHSRPDGSRFPEVECPHYIARREGRVSHEPHDVFWRSDGTPLHAKVIMRPIIERGEVIGSVVTFTDNTEQRALEQASEAKSELLRLVAKELHGPLDADALRTLAGLLSS
jgi:PAS domain S-box-containing protein